MPPLVLGVLPKPAVVELAAARDVPVVATNDVHFLKPDDFEAHGLDRKKYHRCKHDQESCLGEMFDETEDCPVIRRLTYKPLFEEMLADIRAFLLELELEQDVSSR